MLPRIVVITVNDDRFSRLERDLRLLGFTDVKRSPGVIISEADRGVASPLCQRLCTNPTIGIFLAHRRAWEEVLSLGRPCVILEDDVAFCDEFKARLVEAISSFRGDMLAIGNIYYGKEEYNFLDKVITFLYSAGRQVTVPEGAYDLRFLIGAHGYFITPRAAGLLLHHLNRPTWHVDWEIGSLARKGVLKVQGLRPSLVFQSDFDNSTQSNHGSERYDTDTVPMDFAMNFRFCRLGRIEVTIKALVVTVCLVFALAGIAIARKLVRAS